MKDRRRIWLSAPMLTDGLVLHLPVHSKFPQNSSIKPSSSIALDGIDDYIEIPKMNHIEGQIRFFCCPIDFHTILHILIALIKNWGGATVYIIKPTSEKWMPLGRSY